jgi:hypothetical protein
MAHHLKDLTIELDEKVGSVAAAAEALGKAGVNIEGICGFVVAGKGVGHVLVGDPAKARQALQSAGNEDARGDRRPGYREGARCHRRRRRHSPIISFTEREGQIHLDDTLSDAFRRSEQSLMAIGTGIRKRDQAAGQLEAVVPISWRSWGENIRVDLAGVDGDVLVQVKSKSTLRTTLIDWGKNAENVRRFLGALT